VPPGMDIPRHLWNFSHTMFEEAKEIASRRRIDAVYAPVWDVEGIAFLVAKTFPLITSLQTTMASYLDANEEKRRDTTFLRTFAKPVLALEKRLMVESDRIHAISHAIVSEIERQYDFRFDPARVDMIPLGLADWSALHADAPAPLAEGAVRLCFIGRMEFRKGADVFLSGHLHVSNIGSTAERYRLENGKSALVVQAGTATSIRGRGEANSFNLLEFAEPTLAIHRLACSDPANGFSIVETTTYRQSTDGWQRDV